MFFLLLVGERAKRARHSQVCSIENRGYIYYIVRAIRAIIVLITRKKAERNFEIAELFVYVYAALRRALQQW